MESERFDFILTWDAKSDASCKEDREIVHKRRKVFERNLIEKGLELETEKIERTESTFVKVRAPTEVLRQYAEILKIRMPMKQDFEHMHENKPWFSVLTSYFELDPVKFPTKAYSMTAVYSREKKDIFDSDENIFTFDIRSRIVHFILSRTRYSDDDFCGFGIEQLLADGVYAASYPLHDGDLKSCGTKRNLLYTEWASLSNGLQNQPLDEIREYFGAEIGLYFAWLGFYTHMLIPASILGVLCFLYGCFTLYNDQYSADICNEAANVTMCPLCDKLCPYWQLHDTCLYARLTYLFDNNATILFAIVMSLWSAVFLECWKRYSAEIRHRWGLNGLDIHEESPRTKYLALLKRLRKKETKLNAITRLEEPRVPYWRMKFPHRLLTSSMVLFLIFLAIAAVIAVVFYRLALMLTISYYGESGVHSWGLLFVDISSALINFVFITIFNLIYSYLAEYLTEFELHRTQSQFDDSVAFKEYILQFVNCYASIFYTVFFKGRFVGSPAKYTRLFGKFRQEECSPGGCMSELCIQVATIMIADQALNATLEWLWPITLKSYQRFKSVKAKDYSGGTCNSQWEKDFKLLDLGSRPLFPEYLKMVIQYGYMTIFVAAFPLAPLFALLNNVFETRLDAKKLLKYYRRPVSQRVRDIGIWYTILDLISKIAVLSNAFIIAFTSNFIPKMVYRYNHGSLDGFLNHTLSTFDTSDMKPESHPASYVMMNYTEEPGVCRYATYRYSYDHNDPEMKYKKSYDYWIVWMSRLAFVVVFENVVIASVVFLRWLIPDMSQKLQNQIRREIFLVNGDIFGDNELKASQSLRKRNTQQDALDERNLQAVQAFV